MFNVLIGDNRDTLRTLPDGSVHCCVTSPPYWGLRDYGTAEWEGGDDECDHKKISNPLAGIAKSGLEGGKESNGHQQEGFRDTCGKCGAVRIDRQLGLEKTPEEYVASMVAVFREVRRVLRDDGTLWLNLGDSYAGSWGNYGGQNRGNGTQREIVNGSAVPNPAYDGRESERPPTASVPGLKPKDLVGIPWRVAFALQADGWYLRSDIIWAKPNPMPESVTDRPTKAHEYLFLLTKSPRYFYDAEAIKDAAAYPQGMNGKSPIKSPHGQGFSAGRSNGSTDGTRNRRSVWTVATAPYSACHFATYPPKLIEPCIKAGTSEKGCCPTCGAGWERVVETSRGYSGCGNPYSAEEQKVVGNQLSRDRKGTAYYERAPIATTTGWQPTCDCGGEPIPCTVLDPFGGSGTTAGVANALGRRAILCELSEDYAKLIPDRVRSIVDAYYGRVAMPSVKPAAGQMDLFGERDTQRRLIE